MANAYEKLDTVQFDNLVNEVGTAPVINGLRTIRKGQGVLKRGSVLALSAGTGGDGVLVLLGTNATSNETLTANCILAEDVDTGSGSNVNALVYLSGHFNKNNLILGNSKTITAADIEALRAAGIFLAASME